MAARTELFAFTCEAYAGPSCGSVSFRFLAKGQTSLWGELQLPKPSRMLRFPASGFVERCLPRKEACKTVLLRLSSAPVEQSPLPAPPGWGPQQSQAQRSHGVVARGLEGPQGPGVAGSVINQQHKGLGGVACRAELSVNRGGYQGFSWPNISKKLRNYRLQGARLMSSQPRIYLKLLQSCLNCRWSQTPESGGIWQIS